MDAIPPSVSPRASTTINELHGPIPITACPTANNANAPESRTPVALLPSHRSKNRGGSIGPELGCTFPSCYQGHYKIHPVSTSRNEVRMHRTFTLRRPLVTRGQAYLFCSLNHEVCGLTQTICGSRWREEWQLKHFSSVHFVGGPSSDTRPPAVYENIEMGLLDPPNDKLQSRWP